eukprot:scaffold16165_cov126-Skeletonema_marinoi.AAC.4
MHTKRSKRRRSMLQAGASIQLCYSRKHPQRSKTKSVLQHWRMQNTSENRDEGCIWHGAKLKLSHVSTKVGCTKQARNRKGRGVLQAW